LLSIYKPCHLPPAVLLTSPLPCWSYTKYTPLVPSIKEGKLAAVLIKCFLSPIPNTLSLVENKVLAAII